MVLGGVVISEFIVNYVEIGSEDLGFKVIDVLVLWEWKEKTVAVFKSK